MKEERMDSNNSEKDREIITAAPKGTDEWDGKIIM